MKTMIETGVLFGEIHSFKDLNLILSSVAISPAKPKLNLIDVPGGNGSLDMTEAPGEVKFNDRECSLVFTVFPRDPLTFDERKTLVANALNGLRCKITLDKDPDFYYLGRLTVDEYAQDRNLKQIKIAATVQPYKLHQHPTVVEIPLEWAEQEIHLTNGRKTVTPTITCTGEAQIIRGGAVFNLQAGTYKILDLQLKQGDNALTVAGEGTMTIEYQEGEL